MAVDNPQSPPKRRLTARPVAVVASCVVIALGIALVVSGAFTDEPDLRLGTAFGPITSTPPATVATTVAPPGPHTTTTEPTTTTTPTTVGVVAATTTIPTVASTAKPAPTQPAPRTTVAATAPPATPAPSSTVTYGRQGAVESEVLAATNRDRSAAGVGTLTRSTCMDNAAARWANHMAQTGEMAHSDESAGLVQGCRGATAYWGDNVGWWDPCSAIEMEQWWMGSSAHRHNVLSANFEVIGIAVVPGARGYCWFQVLFGS